MTEIERSEHLKERPGNTKQVSQAVKWVFTLNNYSDEEYEKSVFLFKNSENIKSYIVGKEVGKSGTPHLQGFIHTVKRIRPSELGLSKRIHWEQAKGSPEKNYIYCSKEGNFVTNMKKPVIGNKGFNKNAPIIRLTAVLGDKLLPWQKVVVDLISKPPDDRTIIWIWDSLGNKGKSWLCKYLVMNKGAVLVEGSKKGVLNMALRNPSSLYIYDLERSMEDRVPYSSLEKLKNGLYMVDKYEGGMVCEDSPHVVVFANFKPDKSALSADRWHIMNLDKFEAEHGFSI